MKMKTKIGKSFDSFFILTSLRQPDFPENLRRIAALRLFFLIKTVAFSDKVQTFVRFISIFSHSTNGDSPLI